MINYTKQTNIQIDALFNSILILCRDPVFYTKFDIIDTFQNRIHLIFIHFSFIFMKIKQNNKNEMFKNFYQRLFDSIFSKIELNMREVWFGDTKINNNMRLLVKKFYNILFNCEKYKKMNIDDKIKFFSNYLELNSIKNMTNNSAIIEYFDKYETFCFDLSPDSVLKGELKFNYK